MQVPTFKIKKGATLEIACRLTDEAGVGIDLTTATIACKLQGIDGTPTVTVAATKATDQTANAGVFTLTAQTATMTKPAYIGDVKIEVGDRVTYSETFRVEIERAITG